MAVGWIASDLIKRQGQYWHPGTTVFDGPASSHLGQAPSFARLAIHQRMQRYIHLSRQVIGHILRTVFGTHLHGINQQAQHRAAVGPTHAQGSHVSAQVQCYVK